MSAIPESPDALQQVLFYTLSVSSLFKRSLSGFRFPQARVGAAPLSSYEQPDVAISRWISKAFDRYAYLESFEEMLKHQTADCCEQAIFLAAILRNTPDIMDKYFILLTRCADRHSFLTLVPRQHEAASLIVGKLTPILPASLYQESLGIVIADPWRARVFLSVDRIHHPLDYDERHDFFSSSFAYQNLDFLYKKLQETFKLFLNEPEEIIDYPVLKTYCQGLKCSSMYATPWQPFGPYADRYCAFDKPPRGAFALLSAPTPAHPEAKPDILATSPES